MTKFDDVIKTHEQFRKIMKEPSELVTRKSLSYLDKHCGTFISRCPFILLASSDADGNTDIFTKR